MAPAGRRRKDYGAFLRPASRIFARVQYPCPLRERHVDALSSEQGSKLYRQFVQHRLDRVVGACADRLDPRLFRQVARTRDLTGKGGRSIYLW
ncbi:hypothetical protein CCR94_22170 [Rhodoblastus sphagnicola]|uniref:Uncharacterized protein n=1 Tax=Rhodoblastus sphagnicola TaxID=333368 RepID=A0A2S6MVG4_9HYPH|nr:hypothetical protein [Rhodoblastus sphagnicola]PPQ26354.1 hypothetical protein CCR94_22170 [Rhodoblastus sphagnicola]